MLRGLLIDIAGVLHVADRPVPGAHEAIRRLREAGLGLRFVTNTSRRSRGALMHRLSQLGMAIEKAELLTAPLAGRRWLEDRGLRPHLLIHPGLAPDFDGMECRDPNAVFLGDAGEYFDYRSLNAAFRVLLNGAPLVAVARNRYFREADGISLDMGAFVSGLEYAADTTAVIVGKPSPEFYQAAVDDLGLRASNVLMVGDDVEADVLGALDAGLQAALVRSGKYRWDDEKRLLGTSARVFEDFPDLVNKILKTYS
jgi:HAD superfamily hydrolase (TIGR01458 family)